MKILVSSPCHIMKQIWIELNKHFVELYTMKSDDED